MLSRLSKRDPHMAGTLNNLGELTADIKVAGVCEETNVARFMENAKKLMRRSCTNVTILMKYDEHPLHSINRLTTLINTSLL